MNTHKPAPHTGTQPLGEDGDLALRISCREVSVAQWARSYLMANGIAVSPQARALLLLDFPAGWALRQLETGIQGNGPVIVVTRNPCAEYLDDLWEQGPAGLLSLRMVHSQGIVATLAELQAYLAEGARYRLTPSESSRVRLGYSERCVLRYIARGWECDRIAAHLNMQEQSVRNSLHRVYTKLDLGSRAEIILYYWGLGTLL